MNYQLANFLLHNTLLTYTDVINEQPKSDLKFDI